MRSPLVRFFLGVWIGMVMVGLRWRMEIASHRNDPQKSRGRERRITSSPTLSRPPPLYPSARILCWVPINDPYSFPAMVVRETWGKHCDELVFTTGSSLSSRNDSRTREESIGNVHMVENLTTALGYWHVMSSGWAYLANKSEEVQRVDWIVKVDYDTFFVPENLKYYLSVMRGWDGSNEFHYLGHLLNSRRSGEFIAGPACVVSKRTLLAAGPFFPTAFNMDDPNRCGERFTHGDDLEFPLCLRKAGDKLSEPKIGVAEPTRDVHGRERFLIILPEDTMQLVPGRRSKAWYFAGKPSQVRYGVQCCASHPISFHYIKVEHSSYLRRLYFGLDYLMYHVSVGQPLYL